MGNVLAMVEDRVAQDPDRLLYSFLDSRGAETARLTRAEFFARVVTLAGVLAEGHGLTPGDRVLLAYPPGLEMICAFFACARAGIIPAPVAAPTAHGLQAALHRMEFIARDCDARAILTGGTTRDLVLGHLAASGVERDAIAFVASRAWIATDETPTGTLARAGARGHPILFLQYTSGSTSAPKGVMVTHDNILANSSQVVDHRGAVGVSWLPQHHDMGLIGYYINDALIGGTLYGFSPTTFIQRPSLWLEAITRYRATATSAPNFAFEYCLRPGRIPAERLETLDLSSLEFLMAAAEPIKPAIYQEFLRTFVPYGLKPRSFVVAYGLAENTLAVTSYGRTTLSVNRPALAHGRVRVTTRASEVAAATHIMSCGRALGDTQVLVVDPDARTALPEGRIGEIWVTGASKCAGYWRNTEATDATFHATLAAGEGEGEFLRTGDMGFLRDGELYVCGRRKDLIIVRGQNHYPQDIEAVVERASSAVRAGGVAAFEYEEDDQQVIAVVAELAGSKRVPDGAAILTAVRKYLGVEVDRLVFTPPKSVPKTSSGKIMRFMARRMLAEGRFQIAHEAVAPRFSRGAADGPETEGPFRAIGARYNLTGDEDYALAEAGLDSLDLVLLLHELTELLANKGAADLSESVDIRLVQMLTVREVFRLADRFETDPQTAIAQIRLMISAKLDSGRENERALMTADRRMGFEPVRRRSAFGHVSGGAVLLTGATGFLGPFLLDSLLRQGSGVIYALVRAADVEEGAARLRQGLAAAGLSASLRGAFEKRVVAVPGDLEQAHFGLSPRAWAALADRVDTIYHNGALVNYLFTYQRMRAANVLGTNEVLKLAFEGRDKVLNHISTTFIFGWAVKPILGEDDANAEMALLDFGYSQSKWAAEQVVLQARAKGLPTRIFRPSLITPSLAGGGGGLDITLRLLAFMVRHGISVNTLNQVSFTPADIIANNIVAISTEPRTLHGTFHMTRDDYCNMPTITGIISKLTGRRFDLFDLSKFVPEVIHRCTPEDPLYPLLGFLVNSIDNISSMEFKRYDNEGYRTARAVSPRALSDPSIEDTVAGILRFMNSNGLCDLSFVGERGRRASRR